MSYHWVKGDSSMRRVHVRSCQVNGMIQGGATPMRLGRVGQGHERENVVGMQKGVRESLMG